MEEPAFEPIGTINCLLCGGTQIYPGPKYQNHLIHEHGVVFDVEYLIKISILKRDHKETNDCKTKLEIKKEPLDEIEVKRGLEKMDKLDVSIKNEVQDDFKPKIEVKEIKNSEGIYKCIICSHDTSAQKPNPVYI